MSELNFVLCFTLNDSKRIYYSVILCLRLFKTPLPSSRIGNKCDFVVIRCSKREGDMDTGISEAR